MKTPDKDLLSNSKFTSPIVEAFGYRFAANINFNYLLSNFIHDKAPPSDFKKLFSCKIFSSNVSTLTLFQLIETRHPLETIDLLLHFGNFDLTTCSENFTENVLRYYTVSLNAKYPIKNELHMFYFFFLARGLHFHFETFLKSSFVKKTLKKYLIIWNWPQFMLLYCLKKFNPALLLFL